ncbi:ATP-dependent Clp protease ATP-binding subunit ClpX [Brachyspira hyodysenteriae]|uniref:Membrane-associated ATP-dependent Clp protease ATP-binding subunit n=1 Tax=Brachyspira hyodysenteriae (strain ATCC 49526 / WA1) TaxID=565034 RepID=A0A3B6VAD8_BRAHW|nr:ATP-dependent Clp protease ATP-binding subunit ClpX [Brachyspira hyodysenteriae]ACN83710.1 membrane-associated ATP-dependent Clp protease ATP-binding subunit [Brachyspira hyodysenteriae WA1]AUJ49444.1 peptidase [Brachyspira hyodysenteriae]KLI14323.1 peptidase [Brachyspira hyodysenteriae]KLI15282.1 peptidase [Brachyspira hyodysenteriae]KLI17283.1 peptidase [Brachyspira hyodysenteriae]
MKKKKQENEPNSIEKEEKKSSSNYANREDAFRAYFEIVTKIVYTLNLISDRNDMTRRLSSNIDRALGYDDEMISNNEKIANNSNEVEILINSLKTDVRKISSFKKYNFNIERFISDKNLDLDERFILYSVLVYTIYGDSMSAISVRRILELITLNNDIYINKYHYFDNSSKLISSGIFNLSHEPYPSSGILEITNTLITFINSKVIFAFLEKDNYNVIENIISSGEAIKKISLENKLCGKRKSSASDILTPKEIVAQLDKTVIGQDEAKKALAVHAYLHCLRINGNKDIPFRSNILMIGPTGVGKTYLVKTLADILGLPFARADVTTLTETGYVGDDVEVVLYNLYRKANGDLEKAQHGIVFLDEVDKIAKADAHQSTTGNPSDKAVQEALLSMMNGEDIRVPEFGDRRMMHSSDGILMNTKNILFIFGGAFVGLDDIIKMRLKGESSLGFGSNAVINKLQKNRILSQVDVKDIEKYGMIPEFIGRIPIIVTLNDLTKENLKDILTKTSESPIIKYTEFFKSIGKKLVVTAEAINFIVDKASSMNMGARSLKSIVETAMVNILFNLDGVKGNTLTLTKYDIENAFSEKEFVTSGNEDKKLDNSSKNFSKESFMA